MPKRISQPSTVAYHYSDASEPEPSFGGYLLFSLSFFESALRVSEEIHFSEVQQPPKRITCLGSSKVSFRRFSNRTNNFLNVQPKQRRGGGRTFLVALSVAKLGKLPDPLKEHAQGAENMAVVGKQFCHFCLSCG